MKAISTTHLSAEKQQELKSFKAAAERLVRRAQADPSVAREYLRAIGYFKLMPEADKETGDNGAKGKRAHAPCALTAPKPGTRQPRTRKASANQPNSRKAKAKS